MMFGNNFSKTYVTLNRKKRIIIGTYAYAMIKFLTQFFFLNRDFKLKRLRTTGLEEIVDLIYIKYSRTFGSVNNMLLTLDKAEN